MDKLLMGLQSDPFITTVIIGLVWPMVQAALDCPWWTRRRRVALLVAVALVTQMSVFLGVAWSVYTMLSAVRINGASILDWVGAVTPGGQPLDELTGKSDSTRD